MVYKSVDHGKLRLIFFFAITFIFSFLRSFSENHARAIVVRIFALPLQLQSQLTVRNVSPYVKISFFFVHVEK